METPRRRSSDAARERHAAIDDPALVLGAAARYLEARSRSIQEVRRHLVAARYRPELVDRAIERLVELGILDDEAFARAWVESRDRARPRGERAIRSELALKGVDRSSIDLILAERREALATDGLDGGGDDVGLVAGRAVDNDAAAASPDRLAAERLIARHRRALDRVADPRQRRQRPYALLARNGFDPETCREVAARLEDDPGDRSEDGP